MNKRFMRFPEGKKKAVTLSYDDCMEEDADLIELLEKYQMKATFNLIPGWFAKEGTTYPEGETYRLVTEKKAKEMYEHPLVEVANHGNEHKYMTSLTPLEMAEDTILCRKSLESLYGKIIRGMAYPYGWYDDTLIDVLKQCGITYCRTVESTENFDLPENWLAWNPTCHHDDEALFDLADEFVSKQNVERPLLFYVWGHTFEFERNNNWAGTLIGQMTSDACIVGIGQCLGRGTIISIFLVLFVLPQILLVGGKLVDKTSFSMHHVVLHTNTASGRVRVNGMVQGEVNGSVAGTMNAVVDGNVHLTVLSGKISQEVQDENDSHADE